MCESSKADRLRTPLLFDGQALPHLVSRLQTNLDGSMQQMILRLRRGIIYCVGGSLAQSVDAMRLCRGTKWVHSFALSKWVPGAAMPGLGTGYASGSGDGLGIAFCPVDVGAGRCPAGLGTGYASGSGDRVGTTFCPVEMGAGHRPAGLVSGYTSGSGDGLGIAFCPVEVGAGHRPAGARHWLCVRVGRQGRHYILPCRNGCRALPCHCPCRRH